MTLGWVKLTKLTKIKVIEINLINNYECLIVEFTGADQER